VPLPPAGDDDVPRFLAALGLPGIVDVHVHFLPESVLSKVWSYFDRAQEHYGMAWPVHYRLPELDRVAILEKLGVTTFAPLVYPHRPGMARWLTEWVTEFADATRGAVRTATLFPDPDVVDYLGAAVEAGARIVKVHVQVGGFDPRDPVLRPAWGLLAEAGVPTVVHCGDGPRPGPHTGLDLFAEVLAAHPRLRAVIAHAGPAGLRRRSRSPRPPSALPPRHDDGRHGVHRGLRAAAAGLACAPGRRRRPHRVRLGLPEHPLRVRRAGARGRRLGGGRRPPRRALPALGAARRSGPPAGPAGHAGNRSTS
jgi:Amidohydrolase